MGSGRCQRKHHASHTTADCVPGNTTGAFHTTEAAKARTPALYRRKKLAGAQKYGSRHKTPHTCDQSPTQLTHIFNLGRSEITASHLPSHKHTSTPSIIRLITHLTPPRYCIWQSVSAVCSLKQLQLNNSNITKSHHPSVLNCFLLSDLLNWRLNK